MKHFYIFILLFVLAVSPAWAQPVTKIYASPTGSGGGTSWGDATTIGNAVSLAFTAAPPVEIWVQKGNYTISSTLSVNVNIKIYGGFEGYEADIAERPANFSPSVLINGGVNRVFDLSGLTASTVIDGFFIRNPNTPNADFVAIINTSSSPIIRNCDFEGNKSLGQGGAIFISAPTSGTLSNPVFVNCKFKSNSAAQGAGAVGILANAGGNANARFFNCLFFKNQSPNKGGAVICEGSGGTAQAEFYNCTFVNNNDATAASADVMYAGPGAAIKIRNSIFAGNGNPVSNTDLLESSGTIEVNYASIDGTASTLCSTCSLQNIIPGVSAAALDTDLKPAGGTSAVVDRGDESEYTTAWFALFPPPPSSADLNDLAGKTRVADYGADQPSTPIDLGAYEWHPTGTVFYVTTLGTGFGTSWSDPCSLEYALKNVSEGGQVYVAQGTYKPTAGINRYASFVMKKGVQVYGGFASGDAFAARNPATKLTTLSGEIGATGLGDNSYHVVIFPAASDANTRLDGFTIEDGYASGPGNFASRGGGIFVTGTGAPVINNCRIRNNSASDIGAGIFVGRDSRVEITGCIIQNNSANLDSSSKGGGMGILDSSPKIVNCRFESNHSYDGGTVGLGGGAVYGNSITSGLVNSPEFVNCLFIYNGSQSTNSGKVALFESSIQSGPKFTNCTFTENGSVTNSTQSVIHFQLSAGGIANDLHIYNSIIYNNGTGASVSSNVPSAVTLSYSLIQETACPSGMNCSPPNPDPTMIYGEDPLFVNPGSQDFTLLRCSPARDKGSDGLYSPYATPFPNDLAGNNRFNGTIDMGAFEKTGTVTATTFHVDGSLTVSGNGGTWGTAFNNLEQALRASCDGDEILVAEGTYKPVSPLAPADPRKATFKMKAGVKIYGGFRIMMPGFIPNRNVASFQTILSGDIGTPGDPSDNSFHVVTFPVTTDSDTRLDGFYIQQGNANGGFATDATGGGIYVAGLGTIAQCTVRNNTALDAGAGIYLEGDATVSGGTVEYNVLPSLSIPSEGGGIYIAGAATISGTCTVQHNTADYGGGIFIEGNGATITEDCIMQNNTADEGGGIYVDGQVTITDGCIVQNNTADDGAGIYIAGAATMTGTCTVINNAAVNDGGGIYVDAGATTAITGCILQNNTADNGGGIYSEMPGIEIANCSLLDNIANDDGGGIYAAEGAIIKDCILEDNNAIQGGAIYTTTTTDLTTIVRCAFTGNDANDGGAIYTDRTLKLGNSKFFDNTASNEGGAIWAGGGFALRIVNCLFVRSEADAKGGAIYTQDDTNIYFSTFADNMTNGVTGHAVTADMSISPGSTANFAGSVFWNDPNNYPVVNLVEELSGAGFSISNSVLQGYSGTQPDIRTTNPLFEAPSNDNFSLQDCSPAIGRVSGLIVTDEADADDDGSTTDDVDFDIKLNTRNLSAATDAGAYENNNPPPSLTLYVDENVSTPGTLPTGGTNWSNAFDNLQDALEKAKNNPCYKTILVAEGYYYAFSSNPPVADFFEVPANVTIKGGYVVNGNSVVPQDDPHLTILTGARLSPSGANTYHVIKAENKGTLTLRNLTITGGVAAGSLPDNNGGGVYLDNTSLVAEHVVFRNNTATGNGGAVYYRTGASTTPPQLINCIFMDNTASDGGAVYGEGSMFFSHNTFYNNSGAIYASISTSSAYQAYNNIFWNVNGANQISTTAGSTVAHNIIQGGSTIGSNNIDSDPLFHNPLTTEGLLLTKCSPARDAGDNNQVPNGLKDIEGETRLNTPTDIVDMGVDEYSYPASSPFLIVAPAPFTANRAYNGDVHLSWTYNYTSAALTGYQVERRTSSTTVTFLVSGSGNTTYVDRTATAANTAYTYRVRAIFTSGTQPCYSAYSDPVIISTPCGPVWMETDTVQAVACKTAVRVRLKAVLSISDNTSATPAFRWGTAPGVLGNSLTFRNTYRGAGIFNVDTLTEFPPNTLIYYRAEALDNCGNLTEGQERSFTTPALLGSNRIVRSQLILRGDPVNPIQDSIPPATTAGIVYRWQSSANARTWTWVDSANSATLRNVRPTQNIYYRRVSSSFGCTDTSNAVFVEVVQPFVDDDERARLIALYNSTGGSNWIIKWDLSAPAHTWHGVTAFGGKVWKLDLRNNNLTGKIPLSASGFRMRDSVLVIEVGGNRLDFESVEPFYVAGATPYPFVFRKGFTYENQAEINEVKDTTVRAGTTLRLKVQTYGTNQYQWLKNNQPITGVTGATAAELVLTDIKLSDIGTYSCLVTNTRAPGLTLRRSDIRVEVIPAMDQAMDSLMLVRLFNSTGGANWTHKWINGDQTQPVATWYGIKFKDGKISEIDLGNNNLRGSIPDDLFDPNVYPKQINGKPVGAPLIINSLRFLNLSNNGLSGKIPSSIQLLKSLEYLDVSKNTFSGEVPGGIGQLRSLKTLWLSDNQLTALPQESINGLRQLTNLFVANNLLTALPSRLDSLRSLLILDASGNRITSLPAAVGSLQLLEALLMANNQLTVLPSSLPSLRALRQLDVSANQLTELPPAADFFRQLTLLRLSQNALDFGDLEPLAALVTTPGKVFEYSPQAPIGTEREELIEIGKLFSWTISTPGTSNRYQWQKDGTDIAGAVTTVYFLNFAAPANAGVYTVRVTNPLLPALTLMHRSMILNVRCAQSFVIPVTHVGNLNVCEDENVNVRFETPANAGYTYQWYRNGTRVFGATNRVYIANFEGRYMVELKDASGCTFFSGVTEVNKKPLPQVSIRTQGERLFFTSSVPAVYKQWLLDGAVISKLITDPADSTFLPTRSGKYQVLVTDATGCRGLSAPLQVTVTALDDKQFEAWPVRIYPNPAKDRVAVEVQLKNRRPLTITLTDALGRVISQETILNPSPEFKTELSLENQSSGLYLIKLESDGQVVIRKVMHE